ncbi:hypothetical protein [Actinokineospora inagensis]|uniref:hypothetical protein n=1 Tax=Actinokineospora inagensis TaxID=103730 RepID=UPI0012F8C899|nr:hypothetical protein [Actinokineospora inagensis]
MEWLRGGHDTVVVDLSGLALPLAVRERIDAVCVRLAELTGVRPAEPRGVFDEIEVGWPEDRLLVVLLPPIELPAELAWYVGAVRERVVVFAESAHLDGGAAVTLRVRALEPGEVGRYVASRGVRVADAAVAGIERVYAPIGLTVGVLRRLLHEVWARRDRDGTAIGLDEIAAVQRKRLLEP